ncbi:MAG: hypothetical protein R3F61_02475 [Myxococcota bacterium]
MSHFVPLLLRAGAGLALASLAGCYSEAELRSVAPPLGSADTHRELADPEDCFVEREVCLAEVDALEPTLADDEIGPAYDDCHTLYDLCLAASEP